MKGALLVLAALASGLCTAESWTLSRLPESDGSQAAALPLPPNMYGGETDTDAVDLHAVQGQRHRIGAVVLHHTRFVVREV